MHPTKNPFDAVHWYMQKRRAQVIAESGKASDQYHLGKLILHCLRDDPDFVLQIDGATGDCETFGSVLKRSVECAISLKKLGLRAGDHVIVAGPNHLDLVIPIYAGLYLGLGVGCVDGTLNIGEFEDIIKCEEPKVIFCQNGKAMDIANALSNLKYNATIITFDASENFTTFSQFLQNSEGQSIDVFRAADFNPEETTAFLVATSGTTGVAKAAKVTHENISISAPYWWVKFHTFPEPTRIIMLSSPLQWITAILALVMTPILKVTRLQSSLPLTVEHAYELINKYKPTFLKINPNMMTALMNPQTRDNCDFTSFELILIGGSAVPQKLIDDVKSANPKGEVYVGYGMSEISGLCFANYNSVPGSCGQLLNCALVRLVHPETGADVSEPNIPGELWLNGPVLFKGYCNNEELTRQSLSDDGWLMSGDIFYRDENWNFFFVDRMKMLLKYKNHQNKKNRNGYYLTDIASRSESVIRKHPGVLEVAVTGIPHPTDGDLPVACIVPQSGIKVTEKDIQNLVQDALSDSKQLRGGVLFLDELPLTVSSKINRAKLKSLVLELINKNNKAIL